MFSTTNSDAHLAEVATLIAPQGRFALIDDPKTLDVMLLKRKSISLHWELMFTRALFKTPDMDAQHRILNQVSELVDEGTIKTTLADDFGKINASQSEESTCADRKRPRQRQNRTVRVLSMPITLAYMIEGRPKEQRSIVALLFTNVMRHIDKHVADMLVGKLIEDLLCLPVAAYQPCPAQQAQMVAYQRLRQIEARRDITN